MPIVTIDDREIEIPEGVKLNGIQAARRAGIEIPHYCWHPGLQVVGSCRMCLVETGTRDSATGRITMLPKLVPACATTAIHGTVFVTNSDKVKQARAQVEEDLLLRHPIDCPICDKAGECLLQDYHFRHGQAQRRADIHPFTSRRRDLGDVTLFVDRCIMCSRCVRFTQEVSGTRELMVTNRGAREEIDVVPGFPLHNPLSGNVVDLCPVGALCDKEFLYKQRVWYLQSRPSVCTTCATGCSIWIDENQDRIYRIRPRENLQVNQWWICNDGRHSYPHVHSERRLTSPRRHEGETATELDWTGLPAQIEEQLGKAGHLAAAISPFLSVEEAYLLCRFVRQLDSQALLVLGPVPVVGEDQRFPKGFTISAEKCPNRRGVEAILGHFTGRVDHFDRLLAELGQRQIRGAWVSGGYRDAWIDEPTARRFEGLEVLVVQDLFTSPLSQRADFELPGAAFAEREGSYVNRNDHLQTAHWAIRPPLGVRSEGSLYWELLKMKGLYSARNVLDELAREILYFNAAIRPVPETGINLKINLFAEPRVESAGMSA